MQLSYILAAASALISFVPGISATTDAENGRGLRRHRSYGRNDGYDQYYGRDNYNEYGNDNYGYENDNNYDYNRGGHNRNHGGHGGYYRYRRNEDAVKQVDTAENIEQAKQSTVAEQADGHRRRHHNRRSGRRHYGNNDYDYDYDYGYGRRSGRHNRRNSYYYY